VKLLKKLLGERDVEAVLHRLDRLTREEALTAAAHTLDVVHGLAQNMTVVMDGEQTHSAYRPLAVKRSSLQMARHRLTLCGLSSVRYS
jgi:hypothetical protein